MADQKINIILCGLGRIGDVHYKNLVLNSRVHLAAVVDVDENALKRVRTDSGIEGFSDLKSALDKYPKVSGVVVCTPTATHTSYIQIALERKIHVFCEKPISLNHKEVDSCYELAKKQGVHLLCGFQRRSDPNFMKLKEHLDNKSIGRIQIVKTTSRDHPVPAISFLKISGGFFHDCASHDLDVQRWLTGEDPEEIMAYASCFRPDIKEINDVDTAIILLRYPSGVIGSIDLSRKSAYGYDQRIEVHGENGMVQAENTKKNTVVLSTDQGVSHSTGPHSFQDRYPLAYATEMEHFLDIVIGKASPKVTHDDVKKVAVMSGGAEESFKTGKPVKLVYHNV
eukprot:TRINITY_DN4_c0_g1_i1.p1 TRINITY_DN4_c0_g1~~TRINITY_DN4_c0_g1_i1.p1  ORF type:complete len:339 (-),score=49.75 TRINITY_DN4_c0_g1_i1:177-1193(-)